ncbi:MAG: ATP-binding cassette domain-containing protein [Planctomycetia bacterium]|nr:ATP-binding cassette domain-containing protein [Planctomycetia bacterium]
MTQIPVIAAKDLVKQFHIFRPITPVKGVSIHVNQGEIVALLGTNGAGKSTTFDMLSGLTRPTEGAIYLYDETANDWLDITREPLYRRALRGICYLPQKPSIFANLTARENLLGIMEIMDQEDLRRSMRSMDSTLQTREDFCDMLLTKFNLYEHGSKRASNLSGGEQRRLEIARSFIRKPRLILMDEPYAAVDLAGVQLCSNLFREVRDEGVSILIIDHRIEDILKISDRVYFLNEGLVKMEGTPREIVRDELVQSELLADQVDRMLRIFP